MNKVAIYVRVSTDMQAEHDSLPMQKRDLIAYSQLMLNTDEYEIFEDAGFSGKDTRRPAFQEMMSKVRLGTFTHVLVWKIDRVSRNLLDFSQMYKELKDLGVVFVSKNEQFDTSTAMGEAMLKIILVFAELERNMTSERVTATMLSRASTGLWNGGKIPFGYSYDPDTKTFSVDDSEASLVHLMYDMYLRSHSITELARTINREGYVSRTGFEWTPSMIDKILRNEFYVGRYIYNRYIFSGSHKPKDRSEWIITENHHPAIIDEVQFNAVQKQLNENVKLHRSGTHFVKHIHVFSGHLICGVCGKMMGGYSTSQSRKTKHISYYRCPVVQKGSCTNKATNDTVIGEYFLNITLNTINAQKDYRNIQSPQELQEHLLSGAAFKYVDYIEQPGLLDLYNVIRTGTYMKYLYGKKMFSNFRANREQSELRELKKRRARISNSIDKLTDLYLNSDSMPESEYILKRRKYEEQYDELTEQIENISSATVSGVMMTDHDFITAASQFIINKNLADKMYVNYRRLASEVEPQVMKDFVDSILETITIKDGLMTQIVYRNGLALNFVPKPDSQKSVILYRNRGQ